MKRYVCNQCGESAAADQYGLAPKGWFYVSKREEMATKDFCSPICLVNYAGQEATAKPVAEVPA